jgi:putative phosphoserine phosphatase/1-acylglycerol-3-phosphate O-acyltransferase
MSEDRLLTLGEEYVELFHGPHLNQSGLRLMERARKDGHRIIWVSDSLDVVIEPLTRRFPVDDLICNRLELRNKKVTGKLMEPVVAGYMSGQWANQYALEHQIDLSQSAAYGACVQHSVLLSAIGRPCTVNPDRAMRSMARNLNWPIVEGE